MIAIGKLLKTSAREHNAEETDLVRVKTSKKKFYNNKSNK